MQELSGYLGGNDISILVNGADTDNSYAYQWDGAAGEYQWFTQGALLDEANMAGGRLLVVRHLYVDGQLYADADITWNEDTGEYHIDPYYVKRTLEALAIPYKTVDSGAGIVAWQIGGNTFEMNQYEGTVLKNGQNIMAYKFDTMVDINLSAYGEMTGTTATVSEADSAVYVGPAEIEYNANH